MIEMSHGGGGTKTAELIEEIFIPHFDNAYLRQSHDGSIFPVREGRMAFTTDSFVVSPLFFKGGNIGDLAINGTVNDLLCCGATPEFISCGFIIEEGFSIEKLSKIAATMGKAAQKAGVKIITGDTKVVERGKCDGVYINTSGIGHVRDGIDLSPFNVMPGDKIIISAPIATHGISILLERDNLGFSSNIESDTAALTQMVDNLLNAVPSTRVLRDPTRGGVAATLNEIAASAKVVMNIVQQSIPIAKEVESACNLLGINPLQIANEGIIIAIVPPEYVEEALSVMRESPHGAKAKIIGDVIEASTAGKVTITLPLGQKKIVEVGTGEQLPRIC